MPTLMIVLIIVVLLIIVLPQITKTTQRNSQPRMRIKKNAYAQTQLPKGMDFRKEVSLQALELRIEQGLTASFLEQLKQRVLGQDPALSPEEYEWKLLELKRYLAMNVILRQVPMFSESVDDIWHEMLMFTREYTKFCDTVTGAMIHHTPHASKQSLPDERAWFDWIYGHLFEFTRFSNRIWNDFYKFPLSHDRMEQLKTLDESEIADRWFNVRAAELFPEIKSAIGLLIQQAKAQIDAAQEPQEDFNRRSGMQPMEVMSYAAGAMILYSMMDTGGYASNMQSILPDDSERQDGSGSGSTSCGAGDNGDSGSTSDGNNDGGIGGDSGGSSDGGCSGCSSSSCGGGGGD